MVTEGFGGDLWWFSFVNDGTDGYGFGGASVKCTGILDFAGVVECLPVFSIFGWSCCAGNPVSEFCAVSCSVFQGW